MNLHKIEQRADLLANETWGFARGDDDNHWQFAGSLPVVEVLADIMNDIEALLARVRELEKIRTIATEILVVDRVDHRHAPAMDRAYHEHCSACTVMRARAALTS